MKKKPSRPITARGVTSLGRFPPGAVLRALALAMVSVVVCGWAIVASLTRKPPPKEAPAEAPPTIQLVDDDGGIVEIPLEIED